MHSDTRQVMSPKHPAFAILPGFAQGYAILLQLSFAFISDHIQYESGEEEVCQLHVLAGLQKTLLCPKPAQSEGCVDDVLAICS